MKNLIADGRDSENLYPVYVTSLQSRQPRSRGGNPLRRLCRRQFDGGGSRDGRERFGPHRSDATSPVTESAPSQPAPDRARPRSRRRRTIIAITAAGLLATAVGVIALTRAAPPPLTEHILTVPSGGEEYPPPITVATAQLGGRPVIISAGYRDDTVRVWDVATGAPIGQPITGHGSRERALAATQLDGRPVIIAGADDYTIRVWDLATGTPIGQPLTGHTDAVSAVSVAELDGRPVIISGGYDYTIRVWDLASGAPIGQPFTGHASEVYDMATAELDGRLVIISGGYDSTIRTWDLVTRARS